LRTKHTNSLNINKWKKEARKPSKENPFAQKNPPSHLGGQTIKCPTHAAVCRVLKILCGTIVHERASHPQPSKICGHMTDN
jgi:hypothetical protein